MKKITAIMTAAVALAAVSCQKEYVPQPEISGNGQTFTCTFEGSDDTKVTIDENNTPLWEAGDFIILYNGAKANTENITGNASFQVLENTTDGIMFYVMNSGKKEAVTNNIVERIDITADMISADGKTVTFTKTIDDAESKYYAFAEHKDGHVIYSINSSGKVTLREASSHTASVTKAAHAAVATCAAGSCSLNFKNIYSQVKFDVSVGKYTKVTFEANSGSATTFVCGISNIAFDASSMGTAAKKTDPYTIRLNSSDEGPFYVPVASCANLDKGITIKCYKSDTDTDPYTITTKKAFPLERNRIINLGNLDGLKPVTSYYESWEAGDDILIGGVRYNKSQYGAGTLITGNTTWNSSSTTPGGVFFLAEGVTLTCAAFRPSTSVIIISDKPGTKANFITTGTFIPQAENLKFIFSSLNVSLQKNALLYGGKNVPLVGFYSCRIAITGSAANNFSLTATTKVINTEFIDCDIEIAASSVGIHDGSKNLNKFETIVFRNNTVYSKGSTRPFQFFRQGKASIVDAAGRIEICNNTFYDITFTSNGLCSPKTLDSFYLENNIFAYTDPFGSYQRCLWMSADDDQPKTGPVAGYPTAGKISGNIRYNTDKLLGCMRPDERLIWYSTDYKEVTTVSENPFETADPATGIFTQKTAYSSYGAKR